MLKEQFVRRRYRDPHAVFRDELEALPGDLKRFLSRRQVADNYSKTWEYFASAYGRAFHKIATQALESWPKSEFASEVIFYLCRHSLELSLKNAILGCSEPERPDLTGHSLLQLWNRLRAIMVSHGFDKEDAWETHCTKLIQHIHEADPDGERFRYPTDKKHQPFVLTEVELEGLAVAHWHIGMVAEANLEMLDVMRAKANC